MNDRVMDKGLTHKMLLNMLVEWSGQSSETFSAEYVAKIFGINERTVRRYIGKETEDDPGSRFRLFRREDENEVLTAGLEDLISRGYSVEDICRYLQKKTNSDVQQKIEQLYKTWAKGKNLDKEGLKRLAMGLLEISKASYVPKKVLETCDFFKTYLKEYAGNIEYIGMAFHSGMQWDQDEGKKKILRKMIKEKIPLRILVNTSDVIDQVAAGMRSPDRKYKTFEECLEKWQKTARENDFITVRTASAPIMHRMYFISTKDGKGVMNVRMYTLGNQQPEEDRRYIYTFGEKDFDWYKKEWEYSWGF